MKLMLDENLSRRVVPFLQSEYPGSTQVALVGLERASDREIRDYARKNEFVIVTRDADFYEMSVSDLWATAENHLAENWQPVKNRSAERTYYKQEDD
jgi:predicted nuclease of predicted toxin-antitoxin system